MSFAVRTARWRVPLLGHAPALKRDPLGFVRSLRQYGDIAQIFVGPRRILVVNSPELIRRVLVSDARKFDKGALFDKARAYLGNGLLTSTGDFHRRQRRLAQPAFHTGRIERYAELMIDQASTTVDAWAEGTTIELTHEIDQLS
ncbi:MAG TPA: cytochrome P450, partial [Pseudonocardiaceae bacterium]